MLLFNILLRPFFHLSSQWSLWIKENVFPEITSMPNLSGTFCLKNVCCFNAGIYLLYWQLTKTSNVRKLKSLNTNSAKNYKVLGWEESKILSAQDGHHLSRDIYINVSTPRKIFRILGFDSKLSKNCLKMYFRGSYDFFQNG